MSSKKTSTYKITLGAAMLALSVVLPQIFHLTGIPQVGEVFLPMHIPVLLAGFLTGPWIGAFIGAAAPIISHFITNMPPSARLPFMIGELVAYGLVSGLLYHTADLKSKKGGTIITLIIAMIAGRAVYAAMLLGAAKFFGMENAGIAAVVTSTVKGVYGIALQIVIIPPIVYAVKKAGLLDYTKKSKNR
ncbi:MAG: ECF transporter S component [Clostridia bacterium]|nr:ECF transporter S component [Clostridia bacterium]